MSRDRDIKDLTPALFHVTEFNVQATPLFFTRPPKVKDVVTHETRKIINKANREPVMADRVCRSIPLHEQNHVVIRMC